MYYPLRLHATIASLVSLIVLLSGCGNWFASTPNQITTPVPGSGTVTPNYQTKMNPLPNGEVAFDVSNLLYVESKGITCPLYSGMNNTLTFSTDRLTYDSVEIQQMTAYVNGLLQAGPKTQQPSNLHWVLGSLSGEEGKPSQCTTVLEMTNIGDTPIQISKVAMRLVTDPQETTYSYRLVDLCSFPLPPPPPGGGKWCPAGYGAGGPVPYRYDIDVEKKKRDTVLHSQLFHNDPSLSIYDKPIEVGPTLNPGQAVAMKLVFILGREREGIIYLLRPELTIDISGEERTIQLSQLQNKLVLAHPDQLSCYSLKGNTFSPTDWKKTNSKWCV